MPLRRLSSDSRSAFGGTAESIGIAPRLRRFDRRSTACNSVSQVRWARTRRCRQTALAEGSAVPSARSRRRGTAQRCRPRLSACSRAARARSAATPALNARSSAASSVPRQVPGPSDALPPTGRHPAGAGPTRRRRLAAELRGPMGWRTRPLEADRLLLTRVGGRLVGQFGRFTQMTPMGHGGRNQARLAPLERTWTLPATEAADVRS